MSLNPNSKRDGPVEVHLVTETVLEFDRLAHTRSGMVELYDVETTVNEHAGNRHEKGNRAITIPRERISRIEYTDYGSDDS